MNLDAFLQDLHAPAYESGPPSEQVDWDDAPLPYKLYRGLRTFPLSAEVPLTLIERKSGAVPGLDEIAHLLWFSFGLTRISQAPGAGQPASSGRTMQLYRRFIPSGGGLYPSELYLYLKTPELPAGVYHYDAAHHRLILLREGDYDLYLSRALGNRCRVSACSGVVMVSNMFWKNFFKYKNFSYRLQGLDTGVLIGQLLETAKRFGYAAAAHYQFLDRAVNHLLGLPEREESVYAVIPLAAEPAAAWPAGGRSDPGAAVVSAARLCREVPAVRHERVERSRRVKEFPALVRMNEASMLESSASFRRAGKTNNPGSGLRSAYLPLAPPMSYDLAQACHNRHSPETEFVLGKVTMRQLSALLQEVAASLPYRNDLGDPEAPLPNRIQLYVCLVHVEGVQDGAYRYDFAAHALRRIRPGDHRLLLQQGMYLGNVNLLQVPLCFHVAGDRQFLAPEFGYRGYRILQMEAGMLVQRLLLAASALGMGGRPLLGFDANVSDEIYGLAPVNRTSLIQIPVGPYRPRPRLEGGLHS